MNKLSEKFLVYTALVVLCVLAAAFTGTAAAIWSFVQIVAVIELIYWIASPTENDAARHW
jgi:hypothetical protein